MQNDSDSEDDQNVAVDVIMKGELLYSDRTTACKVITPEEAERGRQSCVHHNVPGVGLVRVRVQRYYRVSPSEGVPPSVRPIRCPGRFIPPAEVAAEGMHFHTVYCSMTCSLASNGN